MLYSPATKSELVGLMYSQLVNALSGGCEFLLMWLVTLKGICTFLDYEIKPHALLSNDSRHCTVTINTVTTTIFYR